MKKLIAFLIIALFSIPAYAGTLAGSYNIGTVTEKVTEFASSKKRSCPVYPGTPWAEVDRGREIFDIELEIKLNIVETPGGDRLDFYFPGNIEASVVHNLSPRAFWYGTLGQRDYQINQASDAVYDEKFHIKYATLGAGLYLFQTVKFYAGYIKVIEAEDNEGNEVMDLGSGTEFALQYNVAWAGNYLSAGVKWVRIESDKEEMPTAAENDGNPSHVGGFIGISFPLSR